MGGPAWLADLLAVIMLVISAYCLGRLVVWRTQRRPTDVDVDVVHGAMGVGMAAMLVPSVSPVPNVTWAWAFGVAAAWLAWRIVSVYRQAENARIAQAHYVPHLVMAVGMIYMGVSTSGAARGTAGGGMAMGGPGAGGHFPVGALVLALFMFGYAVWLLDQLPGIATVRAWRAAPQLALAGAGVRAGAVGRWPGPAMAAPAVAADSAVAVPAAAAPPAAAVPAAAVVQAPVVRAAAAAHAAAAGELAAASRDATGPGQAPGRLVPLSPRLEAGCHIAMAVAMGYMLILMV
jgi:hypothetical protein